MSNLNYTNKEAKDKSVLLPIDLLEEHGLNKKGSIDSEELQTTKVIIVKVFRRYDIQIDKIIATVGPTITLFEITPVAGIPISIIKSMEDDITMSLSEIDARVVVPILGRGTIGVEVPNTNAEIVSMKTIISSEKYQNTKFDLPIVMGKTIFGKPFIFDLALMPNLLIAGSSGKGKSVGLKAIITSLLYKKNPDELKFVMIDINKDEFSPYSRIEKQYLAQLPNQANAIVTDGS